MNVKKNKKKQNSLKKIRIAVWNCRYINLRLIKKSLENKFVHKIPGNFKSKLRF